MTVELWRATVVPDQSAARLRKERFRTIAIKETDTAPLVEAASVGLLGRNHYAHADNPPYWRAIDGAVDALWLRAQVVEKLARIDAALAPDGLRLFLLDAWRPRAVQAYFHDVWMPARLRAARPDLRGDALAAEVAKYWSAPTTNPESPAPHETGAAVDLTLVHSTGAPIYMGSVFDDPSTIAAPDFFEGAAPNAMSLSHDEARANRRILHHAMVSAGFAAHPDEWWHFSFGDQLWAALTDAPSAVFGLASPPISPAISTTV